MDKKVRFHLGYLLLALLGVLLLQDLFATRFGPKAIPYSEFTRLLTENKVEEIVITSDQIQGKLKEDAAEEYRRFVTTRVDADLAERLDQHQVRYFGEVESHWWPLLLSWVLPVLFFFVLWRYLARRVNGGSAGFLSIGKSKAKVYVESDTKVTFEDVAGIDEAKQELVEIIQFLKDPKSYGRLGARMPKGVLLVGPPGTGKTLLARAVAGEAGVPFLSISGSEFVEMFVGVGAARVRDLFEQARQKAPCIIFVDELDALGRARGIQGALGGHDEKEQTLNQLLAELDGFDSSSGIVLLGATNRPEVLDPALLRAGRFDRQVLVDRPDKRGRAAILRVHLKKVIGGHQLNLDEIASLTPGFTGADLANLVNESALAATRRGAAMVEMQHVTEALERIVAGLERRNRLLNERERAIVAHHEMGHALVASALPGSDPVHKISIIPRGIGALGYTIQRPIEDRYLMTEGELRNKMAVLLGGRAAEHVIFQQWSTGAADDLARATDIARNMVTRFALIPGLGPMTYEQESSPFLGGGVVRKDYSEDTAREIDCAARALLEHAFERAIAILRHNRVLLEEGARELLAQETLEGAALTSFLTRVGRPAEPPAPAITGLGSAQE